MLHDFVECLGKRFIADISRSHWCNILYWGTTISQVILFDGAIVLDRINYETFRSRYIFHEQRVLASGVLLPTQYNLTFICCGHDIRKSATPKLIRHRNPIKSSSNHNVWLPHWLWTLFRNPISPERYQYSDVIAHMSWADNDDYRISWVILASPSSLLHFWHLIVFILFMFSFWQIQQADRMSNRVCHVCISFLNSWQSFKNRCNVAQKKQQHFAELKLAKERAKQLVANQHKQVSVQSADSQKILKNALLNSTPNNNPNASLDIVSIFADFFTYNMNKSK